MTYNKKTSASFVGSGNLAWHLAPALDNAGITVSEVYSRNPQHAAKLTERLYNAEVKATLDFSTSTSTLFVIATTDADIADIAKEIILPENAVLVHTSGSQPLEALHYAAASSFGVFYPLQTFSKAKRIDFKDFPIFIESTDTQTTNWLLSIATLLSPQSQKITATERLALHVAAVFASNFTNHMLTLSRDVMRQYGLQFDWLRPLIVETISKGLTLTPADSQTGPARRGDLEVLDRHFEFLQSEEGLALLYKTISQHILDYYNPD